MKKDIQVSKSVLEEVRFDHENLAELASEMKMSGIVHYLLLDDQGDVKQENIVKNIITYIGNRYYAERAAAIGTQPAQVTGMKLGTSTTAVSKTGAGAQLGTYKAGSHVAISGSFPAAADQGTGRRINWKGDWGTGVATDSALAEAVIINEALADATTLAANTISRVLLSPVVNKAAGDTLAITWSHDMDVA